MRFEISATSCWGADEFAKKYPKKLEKFGLKCERVAHGKDDWDDHWIIEINSLDDLMVIIKKMNHSIVVDDRLRRGTKGADGYIELYDDWRE